jgi:SAM-dependent methyltransferase
MRAQRILMTVFANYSRYYDLLYRDKDYASEAAFVLDLIREHRGDTRAILDLGCGTGLHARHFAGAGICVHGVDRSESMLDQAKARWGALPSEVADRLVFSQGDARAIRLEQTFDAVVSLFHVVSYQTTNQDVLNTFETVRVHLKAGGVFVFDCWYGPGVLTDPPAVRVRRLEDDRTAVVRVAEPTIHSGDNIVDVDYTILVRDIATGVTDELRERHRMRYFFLPELDLLAARSGMQIIAVHEWMKKTEPGLTTWNACVVARG